MSLPSMLTPVELRAILKAVGWTTGDKGVHWTDDEWAALHRGADKIRERLARRQQKAGVTGWSEGMLASLPPVKDKRT